MRRLLESPISKIVPLVFIGIILNRSTLLEFSQIIYVSLN